MRGVPEPLVYEFRAPLWPWEVRRDLWTFVTLPEEAGDDIPMVADALRRGFGSVPVEVRVGTTTWRTSVFPQRSGGPYVLPVKRAVREKYGLDVGDQVDVWLQLLV